MKCASLWSALSVMSAWSVSESYFKTRGSDGIQIEWRVFFSFLGRALCDGGWWSGLDCVLSHRSSLTDIWKVPLGKNSGLLVADYVRVYCVESPAGHSIKEPQQGGDVCLSWRYGMGHAWGMWTIDMAPRQGRHQRSAATSTSVQVMSEEGKKEQASFFIF